MKGLEFPVIGTKVKGLNTVFDLTGPAGREKYFQAKVGDEIRHLKEYLKHNNFIAYFLGKKNAGKGTYTKLFTEIFGEEKTAHVSVGDLVRDVHKNWDEFSKSPDFEKLKRLYRGYISFDDAVAALMGRSTKTLLPTEFILALLKLHISKLGGKSLFIDGLPRESDQMSYALYFRDLAGYTDAPDLFILIDIPESVIDERIKFRVVCPVCQTSRNIKLLITSKLGYDENKKEFYLSCDNPACRGARMERKEGDELGMAPIRQRLIKDEDIIKIAFSLHGMPKILLRNHVAAGEAAKYFDNYEITPEYVLSRDEKTKKVKVTEKPWTVKDDNGIESFSLLAPPVVVGLIKQLVETLRITP
ncbi:MAG: hypothetical protein UX10_C0028G0006 [Candidatus Magasanikbacteria bacterium GW2011_GWA2_45_39]|uniref:Adenylate kinase n=1 Tax=Candidatus Magasanikbacteria bacterium GW2011_GWA2_45_39 TaxID=1619041 RepID=A0A0G1PMF1_9BACT|nr:MAG: hypothetical protein UX10_C0028G0006 [Candidatus Magasanikbacteria bacterium GW2011_GWA2_45_39]